MVLTSRCKLLGFLLLAASSISSGLASTQKPRVNDFVGKIGTRLDELRRDCLGVNIIQQEIDNKVSSSSPLDGSKLIKNLLSLIRNRFVKRISALKVLKKGIEEDYSSKGPGKRKECCKVLDSSLQYNARFKSKVNTNSFCELKSKSADKNARGLADGIYSAMAQNWKENQRLKWQYFGSTEGVLTIYPANKASDCGSYDNRVRPWYITTASPAVKKLVIVLDTSSSMAARVGLGKKKKTRLEATREAIDSLLDTVLPEDKIGVVLFNTHVKFAGSDEVDNCYNTRLASAGPFNIKHLKNFMKKAKARGGTQYKAAFDAAFTLLKIEPSSSPKKQHSIILFITDGPPTDKGDVIKEGIMHHKKKLADKGDEVTIITLGLGNDVRMKKFLNHLSTAVGTKYRQVDNVLNAKAGLSTYYHHLNAIKGQSRKSYTISAPYVDAFGLGLLVTVAMPCYSKGTFVGVAGVDITMADLVSEVQFFNQGGPESYAFIVHLHSDSALTHPLLPSPESVTNPVHVNILDLEQGKEFDMFYISTLKNLKESEIRRLSMPNRRRSKPKGGYSSEGVKEVLLEFDYHCSRVLDDYILCVVLVSGQKQLNIVENKEDKLLYHRMDLVKESGTCFYTDSLSYKDKSVVKFSAKAFTNPPEYLDVDETRRKGEEYMKYANDHGKGDTSPIFLPGIVETAKLSKSLVQHWLHGKHKKYLTQVPRRYFGSSNGVLRFFPGEPLPRAYDHSARHWFHKAHAYEDQLVFTTPYKDPLGAGLIVTASHSVSIAMGQRKQLFGVVAADLTVSYLHSFVNRHLGIRCKDIKTTTCFLLDDSGHVVFHPRFVKKSVYDDISMVTSKHITEIHGHIAEHLISKGIMTKKYCQNFEDRKLQLFYEIDMAGQDIISNRKRTADKCDAFSLVKIDSTNLYVVAAFASKLSTCHESTSCSCNTTCSAVTGNGCECPCTMRLDYNYCSDEHKESSFPICTPPMGPIASRPTLPKHAGTLKKCFPLRCAQIHTERQCRQTFGCSWCAWEKSKELEIPYCDLDTQCYGGIQGRKNPFTRAFPVTKEPTSSDKPNAIKSITDVISVVKGLWKEYFLVISFTASLFMLMLLLVIPVCCCKKKKDHSHPEGDYSQMDEDYSQMEGYYEEGYNVEDGYDEEGYGYEEGGYYEEGQDEYFGDLEGIDTNTFVLGEEL